MTNFNILPTQQLTWDDFDVPQPRVFSTPQLKALTTAGSQYVGSLFKGIAGYYYKLSSLVYLNYLGADHNLLIYTFPVEVWDEIVDIISNPKTINLDHRSVKLRFARFQLNNKYESYDLANYNIQGDGLCVLIWNNGISSAGGQYTFSYLSGIEVVKSKQKENCQK